MELGLEHLSIENLMPDAQKKMQEEYSAKPADDSADDNHVEIDNDTEGLQDPPQKSLTSSPYVPFAKHLAEEGLLSEEYLKDIEEDGSIDSLVGALRKQLDKFSEHKLEKYSPEIRELIDLSESGVSKEKAKSLVKEAVDLSKITEDMIEDNENIAESVISKYLSKTGMSEEDILEQIEYLKDTDKLTTKALNFKTKLDALNKQERELEKQKAVIQRQQQEKENQEILTKLKSDIESKSEIIPGVKLSKIAKENIYKNLTTPVALDEQGSPITYVQSIRAKDPVNFEIMLNYLAQEGVFEGKFDSLIKGTKSKAVEELEKTLSKNNLFEKGVATVTREQNHGEDKTQDIASYIPDSLDQLFKTQK